MKTRTIVIMALIATLSVLCLQTAAAEDVQSTYQTGSVNGIDYIAGGVGDEDKEAIEAIAKVKYNVKLIFAMTSGSYVADVPVVITDKGGKKLLEVVSSGPLFYVKLPAGAYTIKASYEGVAKTQKIKVTSALQQLVFTWPDNNAVK